MQGVSGQFWQQQSGNNSSDACKRRPFATYSNLTGVSTCKNCGTGAHSDLAGLLLTSSTLATRVGPLLIPLARRVKLENINISRVLQNAHSTYQDLARRRAVTTIKTTGAELKQVYNCIQSDNIFACTHSITNMQANIHAYTYTRMIAYIHVHTHTHAYTHVRTHTRTNTHTHAYTPHTRTCRHTHKHTLIHRTHQPRICEHAPARRTGTHTLTMREMNRIYRSRW